MPSRRVQLSFETLARLWRSPIFSKQTPLPTSPFLSLFIRHSHHPSFKHLFRTQRRHLSSQPPSKPVSPNVTSNLGSPPTEASLTLSQRLKKLSKEYGWVALGVYFGLSALDFPFCFLAVRALGPDRIGRWEHEIVGFVKRAIPFQWPEKWGGPKQEPRAGGFLFGSDGSGEGEVVAESAKVGYDHGVDAADKANSGDNASIWTQLALAYAVHKSFIFIRIPATIAVTPRVVKTLRGWGWNVGKKAKTT